MARSSPRLGVEFGIRAAYPFEGPVIQDLFQGTLVEGLDWTQPLDASWVVAVNLNQPEYYGAVSIVASKPIGRLEMLRMSPHVGKRWKAVIVRDLIHYCLLVLKQYGCQAVTGASRADIVDSWGKVIERHFHGTRIGDFTGYIARL